LIELDLKSCVWRVNSSWEVTYVDLHQKWPKMAEESMFAMMES
jgi:hypothetical protein